MPLTRVVDALGHGMTLYAHERKPWYLACPAFNAALLERLPEFPLRRDDVMLCSYPKSGCHWVHEMARMLMSGTAEVDGFNKESAMLEFNQTEKYGDIDDLPSPRLLNTHQYFENMPTDLINSDIKVIFVYRNPKDVAVSYYYHHKRIPCRDYTAPDFSSYIPRFLDGLIDGGCYFDYLKDWHQGMKDNPSMKTCILSYEDLHEDPLPQVKKLSTFLDKDYDDQFLNAVVEASSLDKMAAAKTTAQADAEGKVMYRKGVVGDWRAHFTAAQSAHFDHVTRVQMAGAAEAFPFKYRIQ